MHIRTLFSLFAVGISVAQSHSLAQSPARSQNATRLPEVRVTASETARRTPADMLRQEVRVGPNNQPEWTTQPNFTNTRVYVRPPGQVEVVQFWTPEFSHDGDELEHAFRSEVEIGLPYRFQLDLYQNYGVDAEGDSFYKGTSVELRYALADWGRIPLNPTLYGEWTFNDSTSDAWELKLLLGETFAHRWNWAANFTYEQETGSSRETEIAISSAISYALIDSTLNVGIEALWERKTERGSRNDPEFEFLIGPSLNLKPTRNTFISVAPLFGTTEDSPSAKIFVMAGIKFGGPRSAEAEGPRAPASMFGR